MSLPNPAMRKWPCASVRVTRLALPPLISATTLVSAMPLPRRPRSLAKPKNGVPASSSSRSSRPVPPAQAPPDTASARPRATRLRVNSATRKRFMAAIRRLWPRPKAGARDASLAQKIAPENVDENGDDAQGDQPYEARPYAFRERCRNRQRQGGHRRRAKRRGGEPAIPVHRRPLARWLRSQSPLHELGVIREGREIVLDAGQIDDREGGREHRECAGDAHDPKPRILLTTWPTRKLYQTMHATRVVTIARVVARSWESD